MCSDAFTTAEFPHLDIWCVAPRLAVRTQPLLVGCLLAAAVWSLLENKKNNKSVGVGLCVAAAPAPNMCTVCVWYGRPLCRRHWSASVPGRSMQPDPSSKQSVIDPGAALLWTPTAPRVSACVWAYLPCLPSARLLAVRPHPTNLSASFGMPPKAGVCSASVFALYRSALICFFSSHSQTQSTSVSDAWRNPPSPPPGSVSFTWRHKFARRSNGPVISCRWKQITAPPRCLDAPPPSIVWLFWSDGLAVKGLVLLPSNLRQAEKRGACQVKRRRRPSLFIYFLGGWKISSCQEAFSERTTYTLTYTHTEQMNICICTVTIW